MLKNVLNLRVSILESGDLLAVSLTGDNHEEVDRRAYWVPNAGNESSSNNWERF